jgi:endonuclease-3
MQLMPAKTRAKEVQRRLKRAMPVPVCELDHQNAWQLVIATILSAQSTDKMVNLVTPALFKRYPTAADLGSATQSAVEKLVKRTGFYRNKAKAIIAASAMVADKFGGEAPRTMKQMVELPGVARKTANVVLGTAYRITSGMTIDTHARRVAQRLELSAATDPVIVEQDLCGLFNKRSWIDMGHRFVLHGRYVCQKRKPRCSSCPLFEVCPAAEGEVEGRWTARADRERALVESRGQEKSHE